MHNTGIGATDVVPEAILRGMKDGLQGKQPSQADMQQVQTFARGVSEAVPPKNSAAGKEYLARNAHAAGVVTTPSGLQYKILAAGDKKAPTITAADTV